MPLTHLLDTNIASYLIRGDIPAVRRRVAGVPMDSLAVSAVTEGELRYWTLCRPGSMRTRVGVHDLLTRIPSLPWDSAAAEVLAATRDDLKRKGRVLSTSDLMIAAHALSLGLTLVTHDHAFGFVDGLQTEDWTIDL